jgi:predicted amidohydrolase YtcJ
MRALFVSVLILIASISTAGESLLFNGSIYSFEGERNAPVEALAIADGEVVVAGSFAEAVAALSEDAERIDLQGATAIPGLSDAHAHLLNLGRLQQWVNLIGTESLEACIDAIRSRAHEFGHDSWIIGRGWDQNDWPAKRYPTAAELDAIGETRPIYLRRVDGHACWVNSEALRRAGIDDATPNPEGGEIVRDPNTGKATGVLIDNAESLVTAVMPGESAADLDRIVELAVGVAAAAGLSSVHEMGVTIPELAALQRAATAGSLPLRVVAYLGGDEVLSEYPNGPLRPDPSERLRIEGVKLYVDGALGSRGAALLEDYSDRPGHQGLLRSPPSTLRAQVARALARGFSVAAHAIGDRGNRVALDAIEGGYADAVANGASLAALEELRCRVEHVQVVHPDDMQRFSELGVIPSMQPTHCTSDMPWAPARIGDDRIEGAYAWRTLRDLGNILPLGSDFPVEDVSPLKGIYAAITRQDSKGEPKGAWAAAQRLSVTEAIQGFSVWAAEAAGVSEWGRLSVGSRADVTVLSVDPFRSEAAELLAAEVVFTMVDGERITP